MIEVTKSYLLDGHQNKGKDSRLDTMIHKQCEILFEASMIAEEYFKKTGQIPKYWPDSHPCTIKDAMAVMIRNAWAQVYHDYTTYKQRAVQIGRSIIKILNIEDDNLRKKVFTLNKYSCWLQPNNIKKLVITSKAAEIGKIVFSLILELIHPYPITGLTTTVKLSNGISFEKNKHSKTFDYWLQVPSIIKGKPIKIPLKSNDYFENAKGDISGQVTITTDENGEHSFIVAKKSLESEYIPKNDKMLGLDWGFINTFATSDGRLLGIMIYSKLLKWDKELSILESKLRALKVPLKTNKRYRKLQSRIRGLVKNEIGRILNQLFKEGWSGFAVEDLNFTNFGFSKSMNRILKRAGRSTVNNKLKSFDKLGLRVSKVNPAYTSQECSDCGFTHRLNRNGKLFKCRFCKLELDSDINGARSILKRLEYSNEWIGLKPSVVYDLLSDIFHQNYGLSFGEVII